MVPANRSSDSQAKDMCIQGDILDVDQVDCLGELLGRMSEVIQDESLAEQDGCVSDVGEWDGGREAWHRGAVQYVGKFLAHGE